VEPAVEPPQRHCFHRYEARLLRLRSPFLICFLPQQSLNLDDIIEPSPQRRSSTPRSSVSDVSSYLDASDLEGSDESMILDTEDREMALNNQNALWSEATMQFHTPPRPSTNNYEDDENYCGLCGSIHTSNECSMVQSPENLLEYRQLLLSPGADEPLEDRVSLTYHYDVRSWILISHHSSRLSRLLIRLWRSAEKRSLTSRTPI
jgi:hypothetical protein